MRTLYDPSILKRGLERLFSFPGVKDKFRARGAVFPGDVKKPATPAKRPGSGASSPRSFLSSRGGDKTFGDISTKRRTLLGAG